MVKSSTFIQFRGLSLNFVYSFVVLLSTFLQFRGLIVDFDYSFVVLLSTLTTFSWSSDL